MNIPDVTAVNTALKDGLKYLLRGKDPLELKRDTILTMHLDLDSEDGVELACFLAEALDIDIPPNLNPLIGGDTQESCHQRTFGEVEDLIKALYAKKARA